jgi:hypothetical protein
MRSGLFNQASGMYAQSLLTAPCQQLEIDQQHVKVLKLYRMDNELKTIAAIIQANTLEGGFAP